MTPRRLLLLGLVLGGAAASAPGLVLLGLGTTGALNHH